MRLFFRKKTSDKVVGRRKTKARIRKKVSGTAEKPRFVVFKSTKNMYAQLIDDVSGKTLASASTLKVSGNGNRDAAKEVGKQIAEKATAMKIENVGCRRCSRSWIKVLREYEYGRTATRI